MHEETYSNSTEDVKFFLEEQATLVSNEAHRWADWCWMHNLGAQKRLPIKEWSKYGVRVRQREHTISIEWHRIRFSGPSGQRTVNWTYLRRGKNSFGYKPGAFRAASKWELETILTAEAAFTCIRRQAAALAELRKAFEKYSRVQEACKSYFEDD